MLKKEEETNNLSPVSVCVCVCACACMRARVCARARARARACMRERDLTASPKWLHRKCSRIMETTATSTSNIAQATTVCIPWWKQCWMAVPPNTQHVRYGWPLTHRPPLKRATGCWWWAARNLCCCCSCCCCSCCCRLVYWRSIVDFRPRQCKK